jgi:hypothetical protein
MNADANARAVEPDAPWKHQSQEDPEVLPEALDPNDSTRLTDQIRGQTVEHASPPRLEDEGQSGG